VHSLIASSINPPAWDNQVSFPVCSSNKQSQSAKQTVVSGIVKMADEAENIALRRQVEELQAQVIAANAANAGRATGSPGSLVSALAPAVATPLTKLEDIKHLIANPVQRPNTAPAAPGLFDLWSDRGWATVRGIEARGTSFEYAWLACTLSYMFDGVQEARNQLANEKITDAGTRLSLSVLYTYFEEILKLLHARRDFLLVMLEKGAANPGLVAYLEQRIAPDLLATPVGSSMVREALQQYQDKKVTTLLKQLHVSPSGETAVRTGHRGGRSGGGHRGGSRGRGGGGYNTRSRTAADGASPGTST
jgi:hypothetical protein